VSTHPAPAPDRLRLAIVGAGVIGRHHGLVVSTLTDQVELVAVVDTVIERAQALADQRGGAPFASLGEALDALRGLDVVVVCTPTGLHGEVAIQALDAGAHVIVEKPAETTVARTDEIIAAQQRSGRTVTVISQHRFDPSTERVLDAVAAGDLGRITSGIAAIDWWRSQDYYDSGDWRGTWALDGGGALMNQGVHTLDLLIAALGRPVEVVARTAVLAHERIEVEDVAVALITFESGALGVVHATTAANPGLSARLHVHGDRGSAVIDDDALVLLRREVGDAVLDEVAAAAQDAGAVPEAAGSTAADPTQLSGAHRAQYLDFLTALRDGHEPRVTLEVNRRSIGVIEAVYASARSGQAVRLD
jgi:predicted dehydrogenase